MRIVDFARKHLAAALAGCAVLCCFLLPGCGRHFISDPQFRRQVEADFAAKRGFMAEVMPQFADTLCAPRELLRKACTGPLTDTEADALVFLYAYMPLIDLTMHSPDFYLAQVRASFEAREKFAWGKQTPELLFRHFVLPPRINNEDLDSCRTVFLAELSPRLEGMTMLQAALEVNHWCHEKVIYTPTDSRTSGPLAVVARAYGRCGEESVFTAAALRAVGIPARQVYTPRWAHTDDNHAWVEVWVDGAWHYMGACEPEPVLDRAWFTSAAQRAMLVHSWVFGRYNGPEEMLREQPGYTEINVLPVYAPTKDAVVRVTDEEGVAVEGASVAFGLYNYAEFYPMARRTTDANGQASLTTGLGTMVIQVVKGDKRAIAPYPVAEMDTLHLVLKDFVKQGTEHYQLAPPPEGKAKELSKEDAERHAARLAREDSIRTAYTATFPYNGEAACKALLGELGMSDPGAVALLQKTLCNGPQVASFLRDTEPANRKRALKLLESLRIKDLQEIPVPVLADHLAGVMNLGARYEDSPLYEEYVLCPRVDSELIVAWRTALQQAFGDAGVDPRQILDAVRARLDKIGDAGQYNVRGFTQSPLATLEAGRADSRSKVVFGVALLRSLGVPARVNSVTGRFEAWIGDEWIAVQQPASVGTDSGRPAKLHLHYTPVEGLSAPKYEIHYTLGRWENDSFRTLGLSSEQADLKAEGGRMGVTVEVPAGDYRLITGRRLADGTVLARAEYFTVAPGADQTREMTFEKVDSQVAVIGNMNPEAQYMPEEGDAPVSILQTTGRGFFVLLLMDADKEPSRHLAGDLQQYAGQINAAGLPVVCLFKDRTALERFTQSPLRASFPAAHYGYEIDGGVSKELAGMLERPDLPDNRPLVMVADSFGKVFYYTVGYKIGSGEALSETLRKVTKQ